MEKERVLENLCVEVEEQLQQVLEQKVQQGNVEYLYKLIDIYKDIKNIMYWKEKLDMKRYNDYGEYNRGNYGEYGRGNYGEYGRGGYGEYGRGNYGEYNEGYGNYGRRGNYGRYNARGYDAKYRGDEHLDNMYGAYHEYAEGRDSYGADEATLKSLDKMLQSAKKFMEMLKQEAKSQEEVEMIKETAQEISEL